MCNCGKKREEFGTSHSSTQSSYSDIEPVKNKSWDDVYFEYTGFTALSVKGSVSGRHYRFTQPGNTQPVDYRDTPGMMAVPVLRKVKRE